MGYVLTKKYANIVGWSCNIFTSIVALTSTLQFPSCATIAVSERYVYVAQLLQRSRHGITLRTACARISYRPFPVIKYVGTNCPSFVSQLFRSVQLFSEEMFPSPFTRYGPPVSI